jgi:monoterpene epsilon-lactone hydrolase
MPSEPYEQFLQAMKSDLIDPNDSLDVARVKLNAMHGHPIRDDTRVEWTELGGVRCAWVDTPETRDAQRVLVLCHGGAYVAAGGDGYLFYAEMLADPCNARVLLIDYRLAPGDLHPAALHDCVAAYGGLIATGFAPERVGLIGDSCGGALAVASLVVARDRGIPLPACAITLGGWFDLEAGGERDYTPIGREPFAHPEFIRARGRDYVGPAGSLRDPLASPIHAELAGLPPLFLQVGQIDLTREAAMTLARRAADAGVAVQLDVHPGMCHGFQGLASAGIPEAARALDRVGGYVREVIP